MVKNDFFTDQGCLPACPKNYTLQVLKILKLILYIFVLGQIGPLGQRYTYRVLQTIQMKLILLCVRAERAVMGSDKTALKFKYEI